MSDRGHREHRSCSVGAHDRGLDGASMRPKNNDTGKSHIPESPALSGMTLAGFAPPNMLLITFAMVLIAGVVGAVWPQFELLKLELATWNL